MHVTWTWRMRMFSSETNLQFSFWSVREVCEQILGLLRPDLDSKYKQINFLWIIGIFQFWNATIKFIFWIEKGPIHLLLFTASRHNCKSSWQHLWTLAPWQGDQPGHSSTTLLIKLKLINLKLQHCSIRDAEEHEEKNSIWLKEADLSTLSVDKEVTKQELEDSNILKRKRFKCSVKQKRFKYSVKQ